MGVFMRPQFTGYARLRSRYGAFFIDALLFLVLWYLGALFAGSFGFEFNRWNAIALLAAYFGLLPATPLQATPGKLACGIRIVDVDGAPVGVVRSLARFAASVPSIGLFGAGFLPAAWTRRRQALHDLVAGTIVVTANATHIEAQAPPLPWFARLGACLVVLCSAVLVYVELELYHVVLRKDACVAGKLANVSSCAAGAAPAAASPRSSTSSP
jgi:uncharacterized RDD family membrane protein YckC